MLLLDRFLRQNIGLEKKGKDWVLRLVTTLRFCLGNRIRAHSFFIWNTTYEVSGFDSIPFIDLYLLKFIQRDGVTSAKERGRAGKEFQQEPQ